MTANDVRLLSVNWNLESIDTSMAWHKLVSGGNHFPKRVSELALISS